jgi:hypothetical protein
VRDAVVAKHPEVRQAMKELGGSDAADEFAVDGRHKDVVRDFLNQLKKFGDRPSQSPKEGETSEESAEARQ